MPHYQSIRRIDSVPDRFQKEVFYTTEVSASAALGHYGEMGTLMKRKREVKLFINWHNKALENLENSAYLLSTRL